MKKLLLTLSATSVLALSTIPVISCSNNSKESEVSRDLRLIEEHAKSLQATVTPTTTSGLIHFEQAEINQINEDLKKDKTGQFTQGLEALFNTKDFGKEATETETAINYYIKEFKAVKKSETEIDNEKIEVVYQLFKGNATKEFSLIVEGFGREFSFTEGDAVETAIEHTLIDGTNTINVQGSDLPQDNKVFTIKIESIDTDNNNSVLKDVTNEYVTTVNDDTLVLTLKNAGTITSKETVLRITLSVGKKFDQAFVIITNPKAPSSI